MTDPKDPNEPTPTDGNEPEPQPTSETEFSPDNIGEEAPAEAQDDPKKTVYEQIRPIIAKASEEDKARAFEDGLFLLMASRDTIREQLKDLKPDNMVGSREHLLKWDQSIRNASGNYPDADVSPFAGDGGHWRQGMEHDGEELVAGKPRLNQTSGKVTGESALLRVRAAAGLGTIINIPLWHTGIWLKVKAPSESTLLELERKIAREKIILGRSTMGVAFSNVSVYTQSYLTDVILNHVYDGSARDLSVKALKELIKVTDIPQLVWGFACAIWPNGYRLIRPCVKDPSVCTHIDEAHINLSKLSWVNNRMVSKAQANLMSDRDGKFTDDQLSNYQNEHHAPQKRMIKINDQMSLRLKVPSIAEHERCGFRWVDGVVRMTDEAFGQSLRGDDRNTYILQQSAMTNLRRYSHWITEIVFADDSSADDQETVDEALDGLTGDRKLSERIVKDVEDFIRATVISAIGIPRYDCPSCGGAPDEDDCPKHLSEIIQLEVNEIFFTLHYMRVSNILEAD